MLEPAQRQIYYPSGRTEAEKSPAATDGPRFGPGTYFSVLVRTLRPASCQPPEQLPSSPGPGSSKQLPLPARRGTDTGACAWRTGRGEPRAGWLVGNRNSWMPRELTPNKGSRSCWREETPGAQRLTTRRGSDKQSHPPARKIHSPHITENRSKQSNTADDSSGGLRRVVHSNKQRGSARRDAGRPCRRPSRLAFCSRRPARTGAARLAPRCLPLKKPIDRRPANAGARRGI